ncbi:hypothetical protein EDE05_1095 [Neorhizobium sp. R1-B]|nr:hypothetical protein EDE05_1095 [Neorhizobium sp. R1-B]
MPMTTDQTQAQTATLVDLGAIFVSLELSKSTWLVTALSPCSEKMSRYTITGGDILPCSRVLASFARRPNGERTRFTQWW